MFKFFELSKHHSKPNRVDGMMISINRRRQKNGAILREVVIRLNADSVSSLRLKDKDRIGLAYCEESNLFAVKKEDGLEVRGGFLLSGQDSQGNLVTSQRACPVDLEKALGVTRSERVKRLFRVAQVDKENGMVIFEGSV